jgi:hypothetical protein
MKEPLNQGHYSEVLDRLYIMISNIEDYLLDHPLVKSSVELQDLIESAQAKLAQAYQSVNVSEDTQFAEEYDYLTINSLLTENQYTTTYSNDLPEYTEPTLS